MARGRSWRVPRVAVGNERASMVVGAECSGRGRIIIRQMEKIDSPEGLSPEGIHCILQANQFCCAATFPIECFQQQKALTLNVRM